MEVFPHSYRIFSVVLLLISTMSSALAGDGLVPGSRYGSGRAAAMGEAFLPLGDDAASGLFYNPAVIGKLRNPQVEVMNLGFYGNTSYLGSADLNFYKAPSLSGYASTLDANPGRSTGFGAAFTPTISMRGFAFGAMMQTRLHAVSNGDGTIRYKSLYQFIPTAGFGARLAGGIVRVGYSLQWVNQASGDLTVLSTADPLGYNQGLAQGSALSHNVGFALSLPIKYLPALNVVGRNVLGANYESFSMVPLGRNTAGTPANEPMTVDVSLSMQPKTGRGGHMNLVLAYRDATNRSGMALLGRTSVGAEFDFRNNFFLRGGWGNGYPSAGLGFSRQHGEFSITYYSEELGTSYHSMRDSRFLLHYQVRTFR